MRLVRGCAALLVIGLLALPASASGASPRSNIVGGSPAAAGQYPAQAFVHISGLGDCGGTLITPQKVLTAAHCATAPGGAPEPAVAFSICLGQVEDPQSCDSANTFFVTAVDRNAAYNADTAQNDVAILTLDRVAPESPLALVDPAHHELWSPGTSTRIIGWGATSDGGPTSTTLLQANVPIVSDQTCANDYAQPRSGSEQFDSQTMVCAGDGTHDTCQGDSGGPLMVSEDSRLVLAGVTSWGEGCAEASFPGVYARVGDEPLSSWLRARGATAHVVPPPPPPPDVTPPLLHLALPHGQRLRGSLKHGLKLRFRCSEACNLSASLALAKKTAHRLHLKRTVAKRSAQLAPNVRRTLTLKFSSGARRKLKSARRVTLKLVVITLDAHGNKRTSTRHITLRS
ncbi:MAG TPA: serine protease [Thermoleophilaceae bacterium]|nr:serine protease [Thermoleophilaceae bacterium]